MTSQFLRTGLCAVALAGTAFASLASAGAAVAATGSPGVHGNGPQPRTVAAVSCAGLRNELASLQQQLRTAPSNQKAMILGEIADVREEIAEYC